MFNLNVIHQMYNYLIYLIVSYMNHNFIRMTRKRFSSIIPSPYSMRFSTGFTVISAPESHLHGVEYFE